MYRDNTSTPNPHILFLGGHGAIGLLLLLLSRAYDVTSVVCAEEQRGPMCWRCKGGFAGEGGCDGKEFG